MRWYSAGYLEAGDTLITTQPLLRPDSCINPPNVPWSASAHVVTMAAMDETSPAPQVWPTLRARDAKALIRFLVDAFGFREIVVYGEGDFVEHAQLAGPLGGGVMLGSPRDEGVWNLQPGTFGAYVVVDDADAAYERAVAAGAEIVSQPQDQDYGSRDFVAKDPEGNLWSFGTYRGEPVG
jgi:uncharacterized glyoxalase superfamily protein PhnB